MPTTVEALGLDRLSVPDRLDLIEQLWDSRPAEVAAADVPGWHRAEVDRRRADAAAQPGLGRPWREVLDDIHPPF